MLSGPNLSPETVNQERQYGLYGTPLAVDRTWGQYLLAKLEVIVTPT